MITRLWVSVSLIGYFGHFNLKLYFLCEFWVSALLKSCLKVVRLAMYVGIFLFYLRILGFSSPMSDLFTKNSEVSCSCVINWKIQHHLMRIWFLKFSDSVLKWSILQNTHSFACATLASPYLTPFFPGCSGACNCFIVVFNRTLKQTNNRNICFNFEVLRTDHGSDLYKISLSVIERGFAKNKNVNVYSKSLWI